MASGDDDDAANVRLIEDFRPRLREQIVVEQVLDHLHFIEPERRERIGQRARSEGNHAAVDLLVSEVTRRPHPAGWFRAFVDALLNSGCEHAADYMQANPPEPEAEAENDQCVKLIHLLSPSLVDMKTEEVCLHCHAEGLLTAEDAEIVSTPW